MRPKILVAGIGNIFKADDAFGVEVVSRMGRGTQTPGVDVVDFGIRGFDLGYTLLDGHYDLVILVDVVQRGRPPGTLYALEIGPEELDELDAQGVIAETHGMHPSRVLAWVRAMGGSLPTLRLVGCEPHELCLGDDDLKMGLSVPVAGAVDEALRMVGAMITEQVAQDAEHARCARA